jgi:hypothetical protein
MMRSRTNHDSARWRHLLYDRKGKISAENMYTNSNTVWRLRDHTKPCRLKTIFHNILYQSKWNGCVIENKLIISTIQPTELN